MVVIIVIIIKLHVVSDILEKYGFGYIYTLSDRFLRCCNDDLCKRNILYGDFCRCKPKTLNFVFIKVLC